jgi:uncharacterized protein YabE (DUF348 family)
VQPSPARAEPHDATTWFPLPAPETLPTVDELLSPEAPAIDQGPGPGRSEPHDATAWLPLPESEDLPSIHELLHPDNLVEAPAARDITAAPSPARAEPHDATAWFPLPESTDLPEIHEMLDPERGTDGPVPPVAKPARHRTPRHRTPRDRAARRGTVRRLLAVTVVAATIGALFYGATRVLDQGADVGLRVDGRDISVETGVSTVASLLTEQQVELGEFDRVSPAATSRIADGMSVRVLRAFPVTVDFDGAGAQTVYTTHSEPDAFLADAAKQLGATGDVALRDGPKAIDEDASLVLRTKKVGTLLLDGSAVNYDTPALTVAELLESYKVKLGPQDFTEPIALDEQLPTSDGTTAVSITVVRVALETLSVDEPYALPDETRPDGALNVGEGREEAAVVGTQRVTYSITQYDGAEVERTVISAVPIVEAKPKITYYGTKYDPRWDKIAECETGGNWDAQGPRYQGGLGIFAQTWKGNGGDDFAQNAGDATKEEQIIVAERIRAKYGFRAWGCGKTLGYR